MLRPSRWSAEPSLPCPLIPAGGAAAPTVLLCSLKAGGVGLNLTSASRVHLLDPWW